jgi:hypothetical protein
VRFEQVKNPEGEVCRDDTLSPTEWVNVPLARFTDTIELNGRLMSEQDLQHWANTYYRNKAERALWVEVDTAGQAKADHALLPLLRTYPNLHLRQVEFGFSCPKLPK